jgi:AraC-like DNA-binding protein
VNLWRVRSDPATGGFAHSIPVGLGHAWLVPVVTQVFQTLAVGASLCEGQLWWSIHPELSLSEFEMGHGADLGRSAYNGRNLDLARRGKRIVLGELGGLSDAYVPIVVRGQVVAILVVGPFATARPTGLEVSRRWRAITGRQAHLADSEFVAFLRATLALLVLEGPSRAAFSRLLGLLARLMSGEGRADAIANRAHELIVRLEPARSVERSWSAARAMVDERSSHLQYSATRAYDLGELGLARAADQVLVGLVATQAREIDPVGEAIGRDAFQRAAVHIARDEGDAIAGRVGDRGIVLLVGARGSAAQKAKKARRFMDRASTIARDQFGFTVHFGTSDAPGAVGLDRAYQAAVGAAEHALSHGARTAAVAARRDRPEGLLRDLRRELAGSVGAKIAMLPVRFERYLEAVTEQFSHRIEPVRAQLEIAFEQVAEAFLRDGTLDPKALSDTRLGLDRSASDDASLVDVLTAYRSAVADLARAAERPSMFRQDRSLRSALDYIHQHYAEPLTLERVARVSGYATTYFSALFKKREGKTFERYVIDLRLRRAEQLLTGSDLSVTRVAGLSGFGTAQYLCRVFRKTHGRTPLSYRRSLLRPWTKARVRPAGGRVTTRSRDTPPRPQRSRR